MKNPRLWLWFLLLMKIDISSAQTTQTLQQWINELEQTGISLFYSSDYLDANKLNQPLSLKSIDVKSLNAAIKPLRLFIKHVDADFYVIRHADQPAITTVLIHLFNDSNQTEIEQFQLQQNNQTILKAQNGVILLSGLHLDKLHGTLMAQDYYAKTINQTLLPGQTKVIHIGLSPLPLKLSDIHVSTSLINYHNTQNNQFLSRQDIAKQINFNHDPLRSSNNLAGTTSNGISGKVHTRGGHENESLILLDNHELRNPYHFNDFFAFFSIINDSVVDSIEYYSGIFPVKYGGRLSSVMDVQSDQWVGLATHQLNLGLLNTSYTYRHQNDLQNSYYLLALRTGGQLINDHLIADLTVKPEYDDGYFKSTQEINQYWQMSQHVLVARDELSVDQDEEMAEAGYHDQNLWLQWHFDDFAQHQMNWQLYGSRRHDIRQGTLLNENSLAVVDEDITSHFQGIKFNHQWQFNPQLLLDYGFNFSVEDTQIKSMRSAIHQGPLVEALDLDRSQERLFVFDEHGYAVQLYSNLRYQITDQWTTDIGFHYHNQQWTQNEGLSPRFNVAYFASSQSVWRLGLGRHQQSQHIDELLLEDDEPMYFEPASADLAVLEFNHQFVSGWQFRSEIYFKKYSQTHPYFENLFNGYHVLPDLFYDRIKLTPNDAESAGAEFTLSGQYKQLNWSASYAYSDVKDEFENMEISRSWNQRNALKINLNMPLDAWFFHLNINYHNGWPRTAIDETDGGVHLAVRNQQSFHDFYQVGIKLNRTWSRDWGKWQVDLQLANALNTENACCRNYQLLDGALTYEEKNGLPLVPDIRFSFNWN